MSWLIPPLVTLGLFLAAIALHLLAGREVYDAVIAHFVIQPWRIPFVDAHAVTAALDCHRFGLDVFALNPCDLEGRPFIYPPPWLWLSRLGLTDQHHVALGIAFGLAGIAALAGICRAAFPPGQPPGPSRAALPRVLVLLAAGASPAMLFALERANIDLVILALAVAAAWLAAGGPGARLAGYALALLAGLLKFYPIVLLALAARERPGLCALIAAAAGLAVAATVAAWPAELARAFANVPTAEWHSIAFGANVVPRGLARMAPNWTLLRHAIWPALLGGVLLAVVLLNRGTWLHASLASLTGVQSALLLVAALLVPACFLTGQSYIYRVILLLPVLPAALALAGRSVLFRLIVAGTLALNWYWLLPMPEGTGDLGPAHLAIWFAAQGTWWAMAAALLAILANLLRASASGLWLFGRLARLLGRPAPNLS